MKTMASNFTLLWDKKTMTSNFMRFSGAGHGEPMDVHPVNRLKYTLLLQVSFHAVMVSVSTGTPFMAATIRSLRSHDVMKFEE
jgi:hypothetical protein